MACNEIAALRLALMEVLGGSRDVERQHEMAELGRAADNEPTISSLARARNLTEIRLRFEDAIVELEQKQAELAQTESKRDYYRARLLVVKSAEQAYRRLCHDFEQFFQGLEEMHDLLHELYPAR
jgi:hypothetical protein